MEKILILTPWKVLENEVGWGSFKVFSQIEDSDIDVIPVNPIDGYHEDYHQHQFSEEAFIAASRHGERGVCGIRVNTDAVRVKSMKRYGSEFGIQVWEVDIPSEEFSQEINVEPLRLNNGVIFEMKGETNDGEAVEAIVVYTPSKTKK